MTDTFTRFEQEGDKLTVHTTGDNSHIIKELKAGSTVHVLFSGMPKAEYDGARQIIDADTNRLTVQL